MNKFYTNIFFKYSLIGGLGFLIDANLLIFISKHLGHSIYIARFFSFSSAVFITWFLNRNFIFYSKNKKTLQIFHEFIRYVFTQSLGSGSDGLSTSMTTFFCASTKRAIEKSKAFKATS